jgi:hypothetical protein
VPNVSSPPIPAEASYAADADFSHFQTYKWGVSREEEKLDSLTDRQLLRGAIAPANS